MKKSTIASLIVFLIMLALPVTGAFAASTAAQLHAQKPPVMSQKPVQRSSVHGSGHGDRRAARISITKISNDVMVLGPWNANISFSGGVPVGGSVNLTIYSDGSYNFSGHFHDSGFVSYNDTMVWAVQDSNGVVYSFSHSGSVGGTICFCSRDDNWDNSGTNPALANGWNALMNGWSYRWEAAVNIDLGAIFNDVMKAFGFVSAIIAIV